MEKKQIGRPVGTFKGKEKKIKTGVSIEPRFRRAIVERYASFQEWFDSAVHREFQGEELPVLSSEDVEADQEKTEFESQGDQITKETLEDGAQQLRDNLAMPKYPSHGLIIPPEIVQAIDAAGSEELADMNEELDALEGDDPSNLDPFNQL